MDPTEALVLVMIMSFYLDERLISAASFDLLVFLFQRKFRKQAFQLRAPALTSIIVPDNRDIPLLICCHIF